MRDRPSEPELVERLRTAARNLAFVGVVASLALTLLRFADFDNLLLLGAVGVAPAALALSVLFFGLFAGTRAFVVALAVVVGVGAFALPGTLLPRSGCDTATGQPNDIVVFSHNALVGNPDVDALVSQIQSVDADVVLLQETTGELLAALLAEIGERYPYHESLGLQHVLSVGPLSDTFATGTATGGAVVATAQVGAAEIRIANMHPSAPLSVERRVAQREEYAAIPQWRATESVDLLMGDFNAGVPHALYRRIVSDGYVDAHRTAGCGSGLTWSRTIGAGPAILSLDHALVDGETFNVVAFEVLDYAGSDHKAIAVRVRSTP